MMTTKMGERDSHEEMIKAFRLFDDDETGKISFRNLKRVAKELGENMTDEELQEMIDEADRDGDGEINEDEFFNIKCASSRITTSGFDNSKSVKKPSLLTLERVSNEIINIPPSFCHRRATLRRPD